MQILSVDLGTNLGVAFWKIDAVSTELLFSANKRLRENKYQQIEECLANFIEYFKQIFAKLKNTDYCVVYEKVMGGHTGVIAAHMYGCYEGVLRYLCKLNNIPVYSIGVTEIKKYFTGDGKAAKIDMLRQARRYKPSLTSYDEADAIGCGIAFATKKMLSH